MIEQMQTYIEEFPAHLEKGRSLAKSINWPQTTVPIHHVVVLGLGGSAFAAEVVRNSTASDCRVPLLISRSYDIPAFVDRHTLVISCSYSGNTEETLSATQQALEQGAQLIAITSGGKLKALAEAANALVIQVPAGYPPRTAFGFGLVQQLFLLNHYGLIENREPQLLKAITALQSFEAIPEARDMAAELAGRVFPIYAADTFESAAIRLRQQVNENSKQLCWHHVLPEMNHNELVGWVHPTEWLATTRAVLLRTSFEHTRVQRRFELLNQILSDKGVPLMQIQGRGDSLLEQLLWTIHFCDWLSLYLAKAQGADPVEVRIIDHLKSELARA